MSGKTEQPTRQRLERAKREGQVARSRLLTGGAVSFSGMVALGAAAPVSVAAFYRWSLQVLSLPRQGRPSAALAEGLQHGVRLALPCLLAAFASAFVVAVVSAGWSFQPQLLLPKLERLSLGAGLKRMFAWKTVEELGRASLAAAALCLWLGLELRGSVRDALLASFRGGPDALLLQLLLLGPALKHAAFVLLLLGVLDFGYARWRRRRDLMMSREEVRREHRESEGDPRAKGRRRAVHRQLAQGGPARGVSNATALVVNPTHVAVALRYAPDECSAPYLVGKGTEDDALAMRIEARHHGIPIVKDIALARSLLHYDLGEEIPEELYRAAAAVLKVARDLSEIPEAEEETC